MMLLIIDVILTSGYELSDCTAKRCMITQKILVCTNRACRHGSRHSHAQILGVSWLYARLRAIVLVTVAVRIMYVERKMNANAYQSLIDIFGNPNVEGDRSLTK